MSDEASVRFHLHRMEEVQSTNDEIKHALDDGESEGLAIRALYQSGGYGRRGRVWASPPGGLYLSILLRPRVEKVLLPTLSLAISVACRRAAASFLRGAVADRLRIKWPNDIVYEEGDGGRPASPHSPAVLYDDAGVRFSKLCGISLETHAAGVCVGIGVNVFSPAIAQPVLGKNEPVYLASLPGVAWASGYTGGDRADDPLSPGQIGVIDEVCEALLSECALVYARWQGEGWKSLLDEYREHATLLGRHVRVVAHTDALLVEGTVQGVNDQGNLLICDESGSVIALASGEAHIL